MGGKAFAHHDPPLVTPRIPTALYQRLLDQYISALSTLFEFVASPTPAPDKSDHGDIDILVTSPRASFPTAPRSDLTLQCPIRQAIVNLLQPAAFIRHPGSLCLALKHPEQADIYIQLDINIVPTLRQWHWLVFQHSYGDCWNLLGTSLNKVGLVGTDKGLFVCDAEIEEVAGKKSRIFLSDDPPSVLRFLGLRPENWFPAASSTSRVAAEPFESNTALFTAVTKIRFFRPEYYIRSGLRLHDRQRVVKRDQYGLFINSFLPQLMAERVSEAMQNLEVKQGRKARRTKVTTQHEDVKALDSTTERERVFYEALAYFNMTQEWRRIKQAWLHERAAQLGKKALHAERRSIALEEEKYHAAWIEWVS